MTKMILATICVHLFYTYCQCAINDEQIRFGRNLCREKCSEYRKCGLTKITTRVSYVCYSVQRKPTCYSYHCNESLLLQASCKRIRRVMCSTLLPEIEVPGYWYDHHPEKHLSPTLKGQFCQKRMRHISMMFDEDTVHPKCRVEEEVLFNEADTKTFESHNARLQAVMGAVTVHNFHWSGYNNMFALSLNTERPQNRTIVLELALCLHGHYDSKPRLLDNDKCSGFYLRIEDTEKMTIVRECNYHRGWSFGRKDVNMKSFINLGVLLNTSEGFLILIDMDNKVELGRCKKFSLFGRSKIVVKLNDTIKSKVRFLEYDQQQLCS